MPTLRWSFCIYRRCGRDGADLLTGATSAETESEAPISYASFPTDPATLTDESGAEFLTEAVGGDEAEEVVEQTVLARLFLFLPLINR